MRCESGVIQVIPCVSLYWTVRFDAHTDQVHKNTQPRTSKLPPTNDGNVRSTEALRRHLPPNGLLPPSYWLVVRAHVEAKTRLLVHHIAPGHHLGAHHVACMCYRPRIHTYTPSCSRRFRQDPL